MTAAYSVFSAAWSDTESARHVSEPPIAGHRFRFRGVLCEPCDDGKGSEYEAIVKLVYVVSAECISEHQIIACIVTGQLGACCRSLSTHSVMLVAPSRRTASLGALSARQQQW